MLLSKSDPTEVVGEVQVLGEVVIPLREAFCVTGGVEEPEQATKLAKITDETNCLVNLMAFFMA